MNKKVDYDNGLITNSDKEISVDTANTLNIIKTVKAMQPKSDSEYVNGKKMALTQTNAVSVIASEGDAKARMTLITAHRGRQEARVFCLWKRISPRQAR